MEDWIDGRISIESINGGYGLDLDFLYFIEILCEARSNGWKPSGGDLDSEMAPETIGDYPLLRRDDAFSLKKALEISIEKLEKQLKQNRIEKDDSKELRIDHTWEICWLSDIIELLSFGECYIRAEYH